MQGLRIWMALLLSFAASFNISKAANYPLTTNAVLELFGDSLETDGTHTSPQTGERHWPYIYSALTLYYPELNLRMADISRSGGNPGDFFFNISGAGVAFMGYGFNNFQHVGLYYAGDGGGYTSNQMFLAISNNFQAPAWTTNGTSANEQQSGWCQSHPFEWFAFGPPPANATGGDFQKLHNDAVTNAGPRFGVGGIDVLNPLLPFWGPQFTLNNGETYLNIVQAPDPKVGHILSGGSLSWTTPILARLITDTNVSTACVDWGGSVTWTNHCVITSVIRSGNSLFFNRFDLRLPGGYDVPGVNIYGDVITNDCRGSFVVNPADADRWQFTQKLTNCPAGTYEVFQNGVLVTNLTDAQLTIPNGWNMYTLNVGPYWDKRMGSLHPIRIMAFVNPVTLEAGSAGAGEGMVAYLSDVGGLFPNTRGDALISAMGTRDTQIATNFTAIHAISQPQTVAWEIRLVSSAGTPAPFGH